jgi:hypothetical protein
MVRLLTADRKLGRKSRALIAENGVIGIFIWPQALTDRNDGTVVKHRNIVIQAKLASCVTSQLAIAW